MTDKPKNTARARILICEHQTPLAEDLAQTLRNLGYDVAEMVTTGEEAVRAAEDAKPDLILMDIKLQGEIDGIEAIEQIRSRCGIPVVYVIEYAEKGVLERALMTEPYGYLSKPVGLPELQSTVKAALYKHEADRKARQTTDLLAAINQGQSQFIAGDDPQHVYDGLLRALLSLTESEYGFIDEIFHAEEGAPYRVTHAITNIAWNEETQRFYEAHKDKGFTFYNHNNLSGETMLTGKPVISNDPSNDPRSGGLPEGHPRLDSFLGLPLYTRHGLIGTVGLANRPSGYDEKIVKFLEPYMSTCANIIEAHRNEKGRKKAEEELKEAKDFLDRIINSIADPMFVKNEKHEWVLLNEAYCNFMGYSHEELVGKSDYDFFPRSEADMFWEKDEIVFRTGQDVNTEKFTDLSGVTHTIITKKSLYVDPTGKRFIVAVIRDITESERAETKRLKSLERQERLNRLQQALLAPGELAQKLKMITDGVVDIFGADFCRIWRIGPGDLCEHGCVHAAVTEEPDVCKYRDKCLQLMVSSGRYTHTDGLMHRRVPFGAYMIGRVASEQEHRFLTNEAVLDQGVNDHDWARELGLVSFAGYQLRPPNGETLGVLALFSKHAITQEEDAQLDALSSTTAQVLHAAEGEERLKESEKRFKTMFNQAPMGIALIDSLTGRLYEVNPMFAKIAGRTVEQMENIDWMSITHPDDVREDLDNMALLNAGKISGFQMQKRYLHSDGTAVWINMTIAPLRAGDRTRPRHLAMIEDITERKMSENLIRIRLNLMEYSATHSLDELLQKTLDEAANLTNSLIGFYHFVESDQETLSLQAWSTRTAKEFCKAEGKALHYRTDQAGVWVDCVQERKPVIHNDYSSLPHRKGTPEGHVALIRELVVPIMRSGQIVAIVGIGNKPTDYTEKDVEVVSYLGDVAWVITERKRAEKALKERDIQYRTLFEESIDGVYSVLKDGAITDANLSFCELFGYTKEEMIGKNIGELYLDPADRPRFQKEIDKEGFVKDYEMTLRKRDGIETDCLISSSVHFGKDGGIAGYRGIVRDLTAHKALQKQLQQAQKMEAVGTLAGGIAHDFNNLLQVVLGYSELVLADENLPEGLRDDLGRVLLAGKNGADLVRRLLTFSRKTETKPLNLDLNQRIGQTQKFLERTIPKMIDIQAILADDLARIYADPTQMDQVLMNLAVNARDAMPEGGKLVIETVNVVIDEDYATSHLETKPGRYVLLCVSDTGSGMDKETLEHIFEPFYTTKGQGQGTGLGLAMVFGIVKQHQGFINCYSEVGRGTTFKIYLPAVIAENKSDEPVVTAMPRGGTETILLIDDEEFLRDLGKRILGRSGYTVLTAASGKEALNLYEREKGKISLVLLDLNMPEMGGKECLEELLRINPGVKTLIASGFAANGQTKEAMATGARGLVAKPYDIRQMLQSVREVLDSK